MPRLRVPRITLAGLICLLLLPVAPSLASAQGGADAPDVPASALAPDMRRGMILRGRSAHRILHFTFDDGPRLETTPRLLRHLDDAGVKATFFLVARQLDSDRGRRARQVRLAQRMMRQGHTIGLHGFDHSALTDLGEEEIIDQLDRSEAIFQERFGHRPWLFRPPYGRHDEKVDEILSGRGYTQMMWTITAERRNVTDAAQVAANFEAAILRRENSRAPGGIVILHDRHEHVVDAFPMMMNSIRERNCELLVQGEELWDVASDPRLFYVRGVAGAPSQYAPPVRLSEEDLQARQEEIRTETRSFCVDTPYFSAEAAGVLGYSRG